MIIIKILLSLIVVLGLSIIFVTGSLAKHKYEQTFSDDYYTEFEDVRKQIISFGILAPSSHNMQPWRIVLDDINNDKFLIYIDETRTIPIVDTNYDQMVFSCGTFLAYLNEGANILGYTLDIDKFPETMLPTNPTEEELRNTVIAEVTVQSGDVNRLTSLDSVGGATKRLPYEDKEISQSKLDRLSVLQNNYSINFDF